MKFNTKYEEFVFIFLNKAREELGNPQLTVEEFYGIDIDVINFTGIVSAYLKNIKEVS